VNHSISQTATHFFNSAAIGREFSHALMAAVTHKAEGELQSALDRLMAAGLLFFALIWYAWQQQRDGQMVSRGHQTHLPELRPRPHRLRFAWSGYSFYLPDCT